jgi:hypothetical protein
LTVKLPSSRDLLDDTCATFRLPPRAVNSTFLDQVQVEKLWIEPPFGFGYGKWALAWTTIAEYWDWSNMQVRLQSSPFPSILSAKDVFTRTSGILSKATRADVIYPTYMR